MNFKFYNEAEINYDIEKSWQTKQSNNPKAFFGFSDFHNNYKLYFYPFQITYENFMTMDSWYSEEMKKYQMGKGSFQYANGSCNVYFKTKEGLLEFIKDFNIQKMPIPKIEYEVKLKNGLYIKLIDGFYTEEDAKEYADKLIAKKSADSYEIKQNGAVLLKEI